MPPATDVRRKNVAGFWLAVALAAASLFFVVHLWVNPSGTPVFGVSANTLPLWMSILLLVLALLLAVEAVANMRGPDEAAATDWGAELSRWRPAALFAVCLAYIAALPWLGYLLASAALVGITGWMFGNRRPVTLIAMMVLTPLALSFFFEKAMIIYLPAGRLFE